MGLRRPCEDRSMKRDGGAWRRAVLLSFLWLLSGLLLPAAAAELREAPMLEAPVAAGTLPPVAERVPLAPSVADRIETIGRPGGELRMLMASPKDTRIMVV